MQQCKRNIPLNGMAQYSVIDTYMCVFNVHKPVHKLHLDKTLHAQCFAIRLNQMEGMSDGMQGENKIW